MSNKNIYGKIKLTPKVHTVAYLEVSNDGGTTFNIIDTLEIAQSSNVGIYDFPNAPTVNIDDPLLRVKIRVVPDEIPIPGGDGITVNAGVDQYLDENVSVTNFYGNITINDGSLTVASYQWSVVTPDITGVVFSNQGGINTGVSGIPVAARTTFRLTVTDNHGATYTDDIDVSVARPSEMFSSGGYLNNKYDPDSDMSTWVYLPQGYDALKPGGFPLIIFLHGAGENGDESGYGYPDVDDINALLNQTAGLPYYLYNKIYPMQCVVIMPQLHTGFWSLATTQKALNYAIAGYSINPNQVYVTGLSSGGAGTMEVTYANPGLFAGGIPSNPVSNIVGADGSTVKDIPYLFVHSYNDTQVPPYGTNSTFDDIDAIIEANPQGIYPPLALLSWSGGHAPSTWNDNIYDKRTAPFDFENDFFLFHSKNLTITASNYVSKAESKLKYYDWTRALLMVDKLPLGVDKTNLQNRLDVVLETLTTTRGHNYYMMNLGSNSNFNLYKINNVTSATNGTIVSNLKDVKNGSSTKGFTVITNPDGIVTDGLNHNYMGMSGDMFKTSFLYTAANPAQYKFSGLDQTKYYDVILYHSNKSKQMYTSRNKTGSRSEINGSIAQSRLEGYNTLFTTDHYNVKPNSNSELVINMTALDNYQPNENRAYQGNLVAIVLKEKDSTVNPRTNFGKFNFASTNAASHPDWGTLIGDPTLAVRTAIDPISGWAINTVNTGSTYWTKYGSAFANDNEATANINTDLFPEVVSKSARLNGGVYFNFDNQNYNLEIIGIPGMGFPAGTYTVKILSSTNSNFSPTKIYIKMGKSNGVMDNTILATNNTSNYLSYSGYLGDGETIKIGLFMPNIFGACFINAIIVEKVD